MHSRTLRFAAISLVVATAAVLACNAADNAPAVVKPGKKPVPTPQEIASKKDEMFGALAKPEDWAPVVIPPANALPSFPGAEGAGATTPGGRGGRVIYVTNLDDSGPGSLRAACEAEGPRIVLFQVSGIIALQKPIKITNPFITIAGQTAPGDGVCLKNLPLITNTHDVVIRYLRSRKGDENPSAEDALDVGGGSRDVIIDHCSANWSIDESLSLSGDNQNITLQYCIIGEALRYSKHGKGKHGYGTLARANGPVTIHHCLYIHNDARNPRFGDNYGKPPFPTFDFRNNVIYNYGGAASGVTQGQLRINYVANTIIPGVNSNPEARPIGLGRPSNIDFYFEGNVFEKHADSTADNKLFIGKPKDSAGRLQARAVDKPFAMPPLKTQTARESYETVLANAGATLPMRDAVDARLVEHVRARAGKMINSQTDVGGWPSYKSGPAAKDTDGDGMPDDWEIKNGFDPKNPADGAQDADGDGYTNIEEYLNGTNPRKI